MYTFWLKILKDRDCLENVCLGRSNIISGLALQDGF